MKVVVARARVYACVRVLSVVMVVAVDRIEMVARFFDATTTITRREVATAPQAVVRAEEEEAVAFGMQLQ